VNEARLRELLHATPVPPRAEERALRVVRAAYAARPAPRPAPRARRIAVAIAIGLLILALLLTPAGAKVADLVNEVVQPGEEHARPALTSLPAPGRLLVTSSQGTWVVQGDGSKRLIGDYQDATWSPHGLYVGATAGRELTALEPDGDVHWSISRRRPPRDPRWSPSGFRIAYRRGSSLRVIAGDGTGDHLIAGRIAPVAAAWRPISTVAAERVTKGLGTEVLAYVDPAGRIHVVDADSGATAWISKPGAAPRELAWRADGQELAAVTSDSVRLFDGGGRETGTVTTPAGARVVAATFAPTARRLALLSEVRARSRIELLDPTGSRRDTLYAGSGRFTELEWSPDGRWLLAPWRDADQWLFIRSGGGKLDAVSNISRQFAPGTTGPVSFPRIDGWCCTR
jgi:hypothetical protein